MKHKARNHSVQYESSAPDGHNDRKCAALTTCDDVNAGGTQFESRAKSHAADRTCASLTVCDTSTQYEKTAPTPTSDRVCHCTHGVR